MKALRFLFISALLPGSTLLAFAQQSKPPAAVAPSQTLSSDPIAYFSSKIRIWTRDDAQDELGRPLQREDAVDIQTNDQIGETFKFKTAVAQYAEIDLTFDRDSRKLAVAYLYPKGLLTASALRDALGKEFVKFVNPNGMPSYIYQEPQRTISIQADVKDDVVNVMIW